MSKYELNSKYILKTDNAGYAIDLTDLKSYLKIDYSTDDTLLQGLIKTATLLVEKYTRRELLTKTFNMYIDYFPVFYCKNEILVKRSKLQSIVSIKYYSNLILETLNSSLYSFTQDNDYSSIYLIDGSSSWVDTDVRPQAVNIEFTAGYGATNTSIPQTLKDALKIIVAYMYVNRGDCVVANNTSDIVMLSGAMPILDMYKIIEI